MSGKLKELVCTPEMDEWFLVCCDRTRFHQYLWLTEKVDCCNCGEGYERHLLRWDQTFSISMPAELSCKTCWRDIQQQMAVDGTVGDPSFRVPEWPELLDVINGSPVRTVASATIYCNGQRIGQVKDYIPKAHFGHVTLDDYPRDAEYGTLEPHWTVGDNPTVDLKTRPDVINVEEDVRNKEEDEGDGEEDGEMGSSDFWRRVGVYESQIIIIDVPIGQSAKTEGKTKGKTESKTERKVKAPAKAKAKEEEASEPLQKDQMIKQDEKPKKAKKPRKKQKVA